MVTAMTALAPAASATKTYQVTVDKQWSGATQNDSTKIYIGQSSKTSTANSSGDHDSDVIQAYYTKDSSVNLKEELGFNGGRTYNASWTCTYKSGTTTKKLLNNTAGLEQSFTMPKANVSCTVTNTYQKPTYTVTVDKNWVGATSGDKATIKVNGIGNDYNAQAGADGDSTNEGVVSESSLNKNTSVKITETFKFGNERTYTPTLACYKDPGHQAQWQAVSLNKNFSMPERNLYCVVTNVGSKYPYDVTFVWKLQPGSTTSKPFKGGAQDYVAHQLGSDAPTYDLQCGTIYQIDSYRVISKTDDTTVTGFIGRHLAGSYQDSKLGSQWASAHNKNIFWSFVYGGPCPPSTPETTVTVVKKWVITTNGDAGEPQADVDNDGMTPGALEVNSNPADWGVPITLTGDEIAWPEVAESTTGDDKATVDDDNCSVSADYGVDPDGAIVAGQNNIITVTNYVTCETPPVQTPTVEVNLYKDWNGATGNPVTLLTIGSEAVEVPDSALSTWNGTTGSASAQLVVPLGVSVDISEEPSGGYPSNWEPTGWACYYPMAALRSAAGGAFFTEVPGYDYPIEGLSGPGKSGRFDIPSDYEGYAIDCYFTNTEKSPTTTTTTFQQPTPVTPGYSAACLLVDGVEQVTVTPTAVTGIDYSVGDPSASVTLGASAPGAGYTLVVPSGWTAGATSDTASITVSSTSPEVLSCIGGEQQTQGESATKPKPKPKPDLHVKGESQEVAPGAPSATAKTGETGPAYWTYLTLAAGVLLLIGSARIRRRDDEA